MKDKVHVQCQIINSCWTEWIIASKLIEREILSPGGLFVFQAISLIVLCDFSGEVLNPKDRCKKCQGKKVVKESKILEVKYKHMPLHALKSKVDENL